MIPFMVHTYLMLIKCLPSNLLRNLITEKDYEDDHGVVLNPQ